MNVKVVVSGACSVNGNCENTFGSSFYCSCMLGYKYDAPSKKCLGDNECLDYPCHANANCTDKMNGYYCTCNTGYAGNGHVCIDINECRNTTVCGIGTSSCTNYEGNYECACKPGYIYQNDTKICAGIIAQIIFLR
ncbi:adhesion G protein-coupled receptor L4-like [Ciona intestinalis]